MITREDIDELDTLMQGVISKLQLLGMTSDSEKLEDLCYDILYKAERRAEGI